MKKILVGASALLLMASCQVRTATSEVLPIETTLTSKNTAELDVQPQKISYEYVPTRTERKMGRNSWLSSCLVPLLQEDRQKPAALWFLCG